MVDRAAELDRMHRGIRVRRHASLLATWFSRWFRAPLPAHHEPLPPVQSGEVAITFGGHATTLIRYADLAIAVDPMLGRWLGGVRRAVEPGLAPADIAQADLILISHRHADHLHVPTLAKMSRSATVVVPSGSAALVSPLGFARVVELAPDGDLDLRGVQIVATPIRHGDDPRARGLAYVIAGRGPSVYACGDGAYFSGFAAVGERFAPDIAILPIGGYWPRSFRARHMSPLDALAAFDDLRSRVLVPVHHGAFALSYERLDEPARWLAQLAAERRQSEQICALRPGQSEVFSRGGARADTEIDDDVDIDIDPGAGDSGPSFTADDPSSRRVEIRR
jgi:L-ascorbate metabolism protein UlaG (beta-lactamase superfamily)